MPVLATMCSEYPELKLDITFTDRRVDLIEENIDLAVRLGDTGNSASLAGRKIATQCSVICASPAYINRHGLPDSAEELLSHTCLGFSRDGRVLPWKVLDENGRMVLLEPTVRHIVSHGEALRDAAVGGMGIAFLSTWLAGDEIAKGQLRIIPVKTPRMMPRLRRCGLFQGISHPGYGRWWTDCMLRSMRRQPGPGVSAPPRTSG